MKKLHYLMSLLVLAIALPSTSLAFHQWRNYAWNEKPLQLELDDNLGSGWHSHLTSASDDWSIYPNVLYTTVRSGTAAPANCNPQLGTVQVCDYTYGDNGWLGLAQIWVTMGKYIVEGVTKLNDTYFDTPFYGTAAWRQLVVCQEVGHTFGLDHQDENFNNLNLGTCMDYTSDPDGTINGQPDNTQPNAHDYEQLQIMYSGGGDSGGGGGSCNPHSPHCNAASAPSDSGYVHAEWGRLVSGHGGVETYEKDLAHGIKMITHVTWTLEHADKHEH